MESYLIREITSTITWLGFFCAVFFAYLYFLRFRNKERILLIEKNVDLSEIYKKRERHFSWYLLGYTILGLAFGLFVALLISYRMSIIQPRLDEEIVALICVCLSILFGAVGIILGHSIEQKKKKERG